MPVSGSGAPAGNGWQAAAALVGRCSLSSRPSTARASATRRVRVFVDQRLGNSGIDTSGRRPAGRPISRMSAVRVSTALPEHRSNPDRPGWRQPVPAPALAWTRCRRRRIVEPDQPKREVAFETVSRITASCWAPTASYQARRWCRRRD